MGNTAAKGFQRAVAGPTEYSVQGLGAKSVFADSVRGTRIIDAKLVETPGNSPQLGTLSQWLNQFYRGQMVEEFGKYKAAILDPTNPLNAVEVRVNAVGAPGDTSVPFWENFLAEQGIPGTVVVAGQPTTGIPPIVVPPTGPAAPSPSASAAFWRANAQWYQFKQNAGAYGIAAVASAAIGAMQATTDLLQGECLIVSLTRVRSLTLP